MRDHQRDLADGSVDRGTSAYGDRPRFRQECGYAGYGGQDDERDDPGLWDRFKGQMREGWESLTGGEEDRDHRRGHWDHGVRYGERAHGADVRRSAAMGRYRAGHEGGFGGPPRGAREDRGAWELAAEELHRGWERTKRSFAGKGPKNYARSDARILEDVCDRLMEHPAIDASEIEVSVERGEVALSGMVDERRTKRLAEEVAEDVLGVKDVSNRIRIDRAREALYGGGVTSRAGDGLEPRRDHARQHLR